MTATVSAPSTTQVYQLFIKATPEQIWDAITKSVFRRQYFFGSTVESTFEKGAPIRAFSPTGEDWGNNMIIEIDPPRKLVHTWTAAYDPETSSESESRVTWEIEPQGGGFCKFTLIHDGLEGAPRTAEKVAEGWPLVLSGMKTLLETGEPLTR
jgi:uncharacterized protein YndB with AHSA1/START domain